MEKNARKKRLAQVNQTICVACGCCVKVCALSAIQVVKGLYAKVNPEKCVGCGKCAAECPASIISVSEVEK